MQNDNTYFRWYWRYCLLIGLGMVFLASLSAPAVWAGEVPPPPKERAERLTFDSEQNRWIASPDPVPGTEDGDLDIARQWLARQEYKTARKAIKHWMKTYGPQSLRYPEALYLQGTIHLELGDYRAADDAYQALLNDYPGSPYAVEALSGRFRIAEQYLAGKRRKAMWGLLRVKDREGGLKIMDDILVNYADTPLAEKAQLSKANYYYERGEFELAEDEYARFAEDFPRSRYQPKSLLWSAYSALARFPGIQFDDISLIEAAERFEQFMISYPDQAQQMDVPVLLDQIDSTRADKTYEIARFYERTKKPDAARYYYQATVRRWPHTAAAAEAQSKIIALGETETAEDVEMLDSN